MPKMRRHIILLTYMVNVAISLSLAFNVDSRNPKVIGGHKDDYFGYKVLQTDKGIIVTAPLKDNGTGAICQIGPSKSEPKCFTQKGISVKNSTIPVKHLGLSLAKNPLHSQLTVCSPSLAHGCNDSTYLNSICYTLTDDLTEISSFRPAFQECTKKTVDLVFLFDGSKSMTESEFGENKLFIEEIMRNLSGSSIKFAAVQFSSEYRTVFNFNDYTAGKAQKLLKDERHMKTLTNTYKALKFVLEDIFENPTSGASPDATKVLILITDGDPSDTDRNGITDKYNKKNVIRFVIGVKVNDLSKFKTIASDENNAFKIEDYKGLTGILEKFQTRIFKIEGSTVAQAGDLKNEMSQTGFSAVFHKDTLILGAVGSNGWRGTLMEVKDGTRTQIEDSKMDFDSYLGYSTAVGEKNNASLYFAGAPRCDYKGCVVLFMHDGSTWNLVVRTEGDQIGSYFGAELCTLDVDSDGNTDFLLVGAPLFYQPQQKTEGRIYVYTLNTLLQTKLNSVLTVTATSKGRFGTSISRLADLNGDGLRDVAIGAPLEDDNRGAVYIFLGDKQSGIRSTFSQKIMGKQVKPELRFFGLATDGNTDLGSDGLPDIVVGSQGNIVVLRSRPVVNISARLAFQPNEISTEKIDCFGSTDENLPMVTLEACFEMRETTKSNSAELISGLNISCKFEVDAMRSTSRGFFSETDRKARIHTVTYELRDTKEDTCFNYSIYMPKCVRDTLSPISIKLFFNQENNASAATVLNVDSTLQADVEVPFQKVCRQNDTCIAELEVDFNFMTPTLLVTEDSYFNISITLFNHADDSYNTSLSMHYPPSLSFSRMTLTNASRSTPHSCQDLDGVLDKTTCGVSLPVYRSRSFATFMASFLILYQYDWNDTVSITVAGKSENANSSSSLTKDIPVQFQIRMAVSTGEDTVTYLNLTTEDSAPKRLETIYKIDNLGFKSFPVNVSLTFPTRLEHSFEMMNYKVSEAQNKTWCEKETDVTLQSCTKEKKCKTIVCDPFILEKESSAEFRLSGDVHFKDLKQIAANIAFFKRFTGDSDKITFRSSIHVNYDQKRYVLDSHKQQGESSEGGSSNNSDQVSKRADVRVEFMILPDQLLIKGTGAGLGFLLLIIMTIIMLKLGCFKRKKFDEMQEDETAREDESTPAPTKSEPDSKSEEDKALLKGTEANSNTLTEDLKEELD